MSAYRESVCHIAPGCTFLCGIRIYSSIKTLRSALHTDTQFIEGPVEAFCMIEDGVGGRLVTLCFCKQLMSSGVVAHEVFHAVLEMIRVLHLNVNHPHAEELAAHAITHLMEQVEKARKLK